MSGIRRLSRRLVKTLVRGKSVLRVRFYKQVHIHISKRERRTITYKRLNIDFFERILNRARLRNCVDCYVNVKDV